MDEDNLDSNNEPEEEATGENLPQEGESKKSETEKGIDKKFQEQLSKSKTQNIAKKSLIKVLLPILTWVLVFVIILIIIIGIAMFLLTMPGMVMEQLKNIFKEVGNYIAAFFGADTTKEVESAEIYSALDYLEEMGYDLKGEGFLTDYLKSTEEIDEGADKENGVYLDEENGVIRNDDDKILTAKSDFIFTYMVSDNYVYTIKNDNLATRAEGNWIKEVVSEALTGVYKYFNFVFHKVFDLLGITESVTNKWGTGLLEFYYDKGIGIEGEIFNNGLFNNDTIEIDIEKKQLSIKKSRLFNRNNPMKFNLDGWTGRYGMPLEFLLSVHKATLMPDLAYDMATSFKTNVKIYLHDISGEAILFYKEGDKYINYEDLSSVENAREAGVDVGNGTDGCECEFEESDNTKKIIKVCDHCRNKLEKIKGLLKEDNDDDFQTYSPYIASVINHWYRDVYFVLNGTEKSFVDYDYEYEALMKERWSLYETDENGNYVYYKLNDDGTTGEKYEGKVTEGKIETTNDENEDARIASIGEDGTKVVKKAVTINSTDSEKLEDLGWNKNKKNIWSAYDEGDSSDSTGYERRFSDEELANDEDKDIKEKIYVNVTTSGNAKQTGEGQRTETNPLIKKMFLLNNYFRYDGTGSTAEIIEAMREKLYADDKTKYYGAISEEDFKKELDLNFDDKKYTGNQENGKYKVSDYSGNVSLTQDSLNAFSMLENEHTLDADYIYRDFKELIVELGYFKKEELTDETPRLLEFLVPDIGSYLYPRRSIDKNENESGTMIHSKGDIDAESAKTLMAIYQKSEEDKQKGLVDENIETGDNPEEQVETGDETESISTNQELKTSSTTLNKDESSSLSNVGGMVQQLDSNINIAQTIGSMGFDFERIAESGDGYDFKVRNGNVEYTHYYQFKGSYSEKQFLWSGSPKTIHRAACGPTSCVNILTGYGLDVSPSKDIVGINFTATIGGVKEFMKKYGVEGESYSGLSDADYTSKIEEAFSEGRPIITLMHASKTGDTFWTSSGHFVAMVGQDTNGNIITLDSGSSNPARHTYTGGVDGLMTTLDGVWIADEAPDGIKKGERYVGYLGNEAVVSPVTGVLLEYGTYTDEDIDSVSGEKYRTNIDLKYPPNVLSTEENNQEANTQEESQTDSQPREIVADKVGYAKILVLDAESYKKLENQMSNYPGCRFGGSSFLNNNKTYRDLEDLTEAQIKDKENGWSDIDKTLYGYKEFAERYEEAGISGYVVYIDGFKCELPDENFDNENPGESKPYDGKDGEKIELENYEETTLYNIFDTNGKIKKQAEEELLLDSLYIKDEDYEIASKKATEKLKAENLLKEDAVSSIYLPNEDLIFIKEGTILGRTLTDRELIEDYRHQKYEDYRKTKKSAKDDSGEEKEEKEDNNEDKLVGNYLRIIMRDLDKTVVENVEDYMKLDDGEDEDEGDQEYKFEEGDLELLADAIHHEGCGSYDDPKGSKEDQMYLATSLGFTIINKLNSDSQYHHAAGWDWAPDKSKLYNLLCVVPCADHGGKGWYAISDDPESTMKGLKNRADAGEYEYCDMCMEAAEYIKEHDSKHLKNNGKYDSGYNVGDEMQHTCWEQGRNFYGKRMWAHFREDYLFDPKE